MLEPRCPHSRNRETHCPETLTLSQPEASLRLLRLLASLLLLQLLAQLLAQFQLPLALAFSSLPLRFLTFFFSRSPRLGPASQQSPVARLPPSADADSAHSGLSRCQPSLPLPRLPSAQCESISAIKPMYRSLQLCLIAHILSN